jgi:fatty-acyl-CoA synthase
MLSSMMQYPLTLAAIAERAGRLFASVEIVSRRPDKSLYRSIYGEV